VYTLWLVCRRTAASKTAEREELDWQCENLENLHLHQSPHQLSIHPQMSHNVHAA